MTRFVPQTRRDRVVVALVAAAIAETLWCIYLGVALPPHYVAEHWALAWIGLDVAEIAMLAAAAWAAWRHRALVIVFCVAGATLFLLDAWFDVTTAHHGDLDQSVVLAVCLEVPSALALLWVSYRAARRVVLEYAPGLSATPLRLLAIRAEDPDPVVQEGTAHPRSRDLEDARPRARARIASRARPRRRSRRCACSPRRGDTAR